MSTLQHCTRAPKDTAFRKFALASRSLPMLCVALGILVFTSFSAQVFGAAPEKQCGLPGGPICPPPAPIVSPWRYKVDPKFGLPHSSWLESESDAIQYPVPLHVRPGNWCSMVFTGKSLISGPQSQYGIETFYRYKLNYDATSYQPNCVNQFQTYTEEDAVRTVSCPAGLQLIYNWMTPPARCSPPPPPLPPPPDWLKAQGGSCPASGSAKGRGGARFGNPCDVSHGNKYQLEIDYVGAGYNPLRFARSYNSFAAFYVGDSGVGTSKWEYGAQPVGVAWTASYFQRLHRSVSGSGPGALDTIYAFRPDGRVLRYVLFQGMYVPDADIADELNVVVSGFEYRTPEGTVERYDSAGRLVGLSTRGQFEQVVAYPNATETRPSSVTDADGRTLQFTYATLAGAKRLQQFTDPAGQVTTFAYHANGGLASVTYPDGKFRSYTYGHTGWTLTSVTDEAGNVFASWTYLTDGSRVTGSTRAGGVENYSFAYSGTNTTVTDPRGVARTFAHALIQGLNRTTTSNQLCVGCSTDKQRFHDANGNIVQRTDFNNHSTTYTYEMNRNLETSRTEGAGTPHARTISTEWHPDFHVPVSITEPNRTTTFTHDLNGNVLTRTITDTSASPNVSRVWTYTYNAAGQLLTSDGPRTDVNDETVYSYYTCTLGFQCGRLHTVTDPLGHVTTYDAYNAHGQPIQITDANGLVSSIAYDARQRMTDRCSGDLLPACSGGELTHMDYWSTGLLKKVTNPDGSYIDYVYDTAHRLVQIQDSSLNRIVYTLDAMGNRTAESVYDSSNALRRTHSKVFNTLNQLWKDVNAAGSAAVTTTYGYDSNGNQISTSAPLSRNSGNLYDELDRLKQITDPASGITQFEYDANDNLTSVVDPRGLTTTYNYNGFGEVLSVVSPDTGIASNAYDSGGNLKTSTDARGVVTDYAYDVANRVSTVSFTLGGITDQTITYGYDAGANGLGRLTSAFDANHALAWTYDPQGRLTGKGQTVGSTTLAIGYGYNAAGQLGNVTLPSGNVITFGYNTNGQVASLTLNGSTTLLASLTYDPFGPITGWTWGNGTTASRGYDTDGKVTQVDNANGASLKLYGYDDAFRITGISDAGNSALSWTYGYDLLDRLNSATSASVTQGWTYDANGNRLTQTGTTPSTYSNSPTSNRVSSISGSLPRSYTYDAAGNTLSYAGATFTYNNRGRMATASNGGITATYTYNALGQRVRRVTASDTALYVYDEAGHLVGEYTATGVARQETVWLGDMPVATLRPNGSGGVDVFYVHADHLNTPRLVTDTSNNIRWRWDSDPFGTTAPDENPAGLGTFVYNLRFPGQQYDGVVRLHYNYFRDYDPAVGRYVQSDPIGIWGGLNTYAYASGNPLSFIDPRGENPAAGAIAPAAPALGGLGSTLAGSVGAAGAGTVAAATAVAGGVGYGAGWVFNRGLNRILEWGTGTSLGGLIYEMCNDSEEEKLKKRCLALKESILKTCYGLAGRKRMKCYEAANTSFRQCMGYE